MIHYLNLTAPDMTTSVTSPGQKALSTKHSSNTQGPDQLLHVNITTDAPTNESIQSTSSGNVEHNIPATNKKPLCSSNLITQKHYGGYGCRYT